MKTVEFKASKLFTVSASGNTHKEIFSELSGLSEVFGVDRCGKCNGEDIRPVKRVVDEVSHFEFRCLDCRAILTMGQNKKGDTLYPRRKYHDKHPLVKSGQATEGDWIPNGGWEVYAGERNDDADEPAASPPKKRS